MIIGMMIGMMMMKIGMVGMNRSIGRKGGDNMTSRLMATLCYIYPGGKNAEIVAADFVENGEEAALWEHSNTPDDEDAWEYEVNFVLYEII